MKSGRMRLCAIGAIWLRVHLRPKGHASVAANLIWIRLAAQVFARAAGGRRADQWPLETLSQPQFELPQAVVLVAG